MLAALPLREVGPTLRGELVDVRPLSKDDYEPLLAVAAAPLIWEQHPDRNRYKEENFRRFFRDSLESMGALAVIDRVERRIVGSSRFHGYDRDSDDVEIGWTFLARSHWGGRYNGELKRLMLRHAFNVVGAVIFLVVPDNIRSQRAIEKIGGVRAGIRADASGRGSLVYRIRADDFV